MHRQRAARLRSSRPLLCTPGAHASRGVPENSPCDRERERSPRARGADPAPSWCPTLARLCPSGAAGNSPRWSTALQPEPGHAAQHEPDSKNPPPKTAAECSRAARLWLWGSSGHPSRGPGRRTWGPWAGRSSSREADGLGDRAAHPDLTAPGRWPCLQVSARRPQEGPATSGILEIS